MQNSGWELGKATYTKTWTKTFCFLIPNCLMIVADRSRNYTMSISRPRPKTNISVNLERRDEFNVAIIQNTANSSNTDLWQIQNVRQTWKYHTNTFTPQRELNKIRFYLFLPFSLRGLMHTLGKHHVCKVQIRSEGDYIYIHITILRIKPPRKKTKQRIWQ